MTGWTFEQIARKAVVAGMCLVNTVYRQYAYCPTCFKRLSLNDLCVDNHVFTKPHYFPASMNLTDTVKEIENDLHKVIT